MAPSCVAAFTTVALAIAALSTAGPRAITAAFIMQDAGEGGCAHAAANGLCEKNSLAHKACCETCELHRDITQ